jgi:hypothetical protein
MELLALTIVAAISGGAGYITGQNAKSRGAQVQLQAELEHGNDYIRELERRLNNP